MLAGDGLAEMCVDRDAAPPPDAGIIDAAVPDASPTDAAAVVVPFDTDQAADLVLGQPDFTDVSPRQSAGGLRGPQDVASDGVRLWVSDSGNHRVLQWSGLPTVNGTSADLVIGQADLVSNTALSASAQRFGGGHLAAAPGVLLLSDAANNRILVFKPLPTQNLPAASLVLGQTTFTASATTGGASGLKVPGGIWTDGQRVVVADTQHHRVLIWHSFPTANGQAADTVVGQVDFDAIGQPTTTDDVHLFYPGDVFVDGDSLIVSDSSDSRVLIWRHLPDAGHNGVPADVVVGQNSFVTNQQNNGAGFTVSRFGFRFQAGVATHRGNLIVSDKGNHRVLSFTPVPTTNGEGASAALGQPDLMSSVGRSAAQGGLYDPEAICVVGDSLFVADHQYNRVLWFQLR